MRTAYETDNQDLNYAETVRSEWQDHRNWLSTQALKHLNSTLALLWCRRSEYAARKVIHASIRNYRNQQKESN